LILIALGWSLISSALTLVVTVALKLVLEMKSRGEESMLAQRFPECDAYRQRVRSDSFRGSIDGWTGGQAGYRPGSRRVVPSSSPTGRRSHPRPTSRCRTALYISVGRDWTIVPNIVIALTKTLAAVTALYFGTKPAA
jgi:hypothetical protein